MNNEITIIDALKPPLLIRMLGSAFYLSTENVKRDGKERFKL